MRGRKVADLTIRETSLEPEFLLPVQTGSECPRAAPERNLYFQILTSALHDLDSLVIQVRNQAECWLLDPHLGIVTCGDCCEFLGVDYQALRSKVMGGLMLSRARHCSGAHTRIAYQANGDDHE